MASDDRYRRIEQCPVPLPAPTRSLLNFVNPQRWGHASDEAIAEHITAIRNRCHDIDPWPCLSKFAFISPRIREGLADGLYQDTLANFQTALRDTPAASPAPLFLDFGTGLGQEARAVVQDGLPAGHVFGADFLPAFIHAGLDLWGDGAPHAEGEGEGTLRTAPNLATSGITWTQCDILDDTAVDALLGLAKARGQDGFHTIFVASFLHCFNLERQRTAVSALARLLSSAPGATIFGRHVAIPAGVEPSTTTGPAGLKREQFRDSFRHDEHSFRRELWDWETAQRRQRLGESAPGWDLFVHVRDPTLQDNILAKDHSSNAPNRTMSFAAKRKSISS